MATGLDIYVFRECLGFKIIICAMVLWFSEGCRHAQVISPESRDAIALCSGGLHLSNHRRIALEASIRDVQETYGSVGVEAHVETRVKGIVFGGENLKDPNVQRAYDTYVTCVLKAFAAIRQPPSPPPVIQFSPEQYITQLEGRVRDLKEQQAQAQAHPRQLAQAQAHPSLEKELQVLEGQLARPDESYQAYLQDLKKRIQRLDELRGKIPLKRLASAKEALAQGDLVRADHIFAEVEQEAQEMRKKGQALVQEADVTEAEAAYQRGAIARDEIRYAEAKTHNDRALELQPKNATYLLAAGIIYYDLNAIELYEQALAITRKARGEEHIDVAQTYNNLGKAWHRKGEYDRAMGYFEQALTIFRKALGDEHPDVAMTYNNLGIAWANKGDYDRAIGYHEQALAIFRKALGEEHPNVATTYNNLGGAWHNKGEYDRAIRYYEQAQTIFRKALGDEHPYVAMTYNNLGEAWFAKGDLSKAKGYVDQALSIYIPRLGETHPYTQHVRRLLEALQQQLTSQD